MSHTSVLHRGLSAAVMLAACASPTSSGGRVTVASVVGAPGDVTPTRLVAASQSAARRAGGPTLASSRAIVSPRVPADARPAPRISRDTFLFTTNGAPAQRRALAVDSPAGASVYVLPGASHGATLPTFELVELRRGERLARATIDPSAPLTPLFVFDGARAPGDYAIDAPAVAHTIELRQPKSPIRLEIEASAAQVLALDASTIEVRIVDERGDVDDAAASALLVAPLDHRRSEASLRAAGKSAWTLDLAGLLDDESREGTYAVEVRATGHSRGVAFDRFGTTTFAFALPTARISALHDAEERRDETGLIASFDVSADVEVARAGRYELTAILATDDDRPFASANTTATLGVGTQTLTLRFDAALARSAGVAGEPSLRHLRLFSLDSNSVLHRISDGLGVKLPAFRREELAAAP